MTKLVLFHPMDPRGTKMGGIETHVRLVLARHPAATSLLFVGLDEFGDCELGVVRPLDYEGRHIDFLPVAHVEGGAINVAARRVRQSTTLRFALGAVRHLGVVRRATRGAAASSEIERFEFALLAKAVGLPLVLIVHNEGSKNDKMDSLLKRYWFLHRLNERLALALADRIFAVNEAIAMRVKGLSPGFAAKTEVMSVSVDTARFTPAAFPVDDDAFHVCFAGRLDDFKDPPLMMATLALLSDRLGASPAGRFRRLVFHYVGASDPAKVPGFAAIASATVEHGIRKADEVGTIMKKAHAGIITSFFEGMPCFLLEMLASGRPVCAIALPQFASLIVPGLSGALVNRRADQADTAGELADGFHRLATGVSDGEIDPETISVLVQPFSVQTQMRRLFACHETLAGGSTDQPKVSASAA